MKILHFITNTELGGAQRVCIDLANSAVRENHCVAVASMRGGYLWDSLSESIEKFPLKNLIKKLHPVKDLLVLVELRKVLRKFRPDIIHLHSSKAGVIGRLATLFTKVSVVYTVHGFDSIRLSYRYFLPLERILQNQSDYIVAVSDYDRLNLIGEGITKNVITIHNGVDLTDEKRNLWETKNESVIMTIARIAPPKRFDLFLALARNFTGEPYKFVWIGGPAHGSINDIKTLFDIPDNVILMGNVKDASAYLHDSDLFILLSDFEGLPMTIIEAMSQKKPIVASAVGGISELVDDTNGVLVRDLDDAIIAVRECFGNKARLEQMGLRSFEKYTDCFSLVKMWSSYNKIYNSLVERK